jgi:hypothetical protein
MTLGSPSQSHSFGSGSLSATGSRGAIETLLPHLARTIVLPSVSTASPTFSSTVLLVQ